MSDQPTLTDGTVTLRPLQDEAYGDRRGFEIERDDARVGEVVLQTVTDGIGRITWSLDPDHRGRGSATRAVVVLVDWALTERGQQGLGLGRVEAHVPPEDRASHRIATRAGLRREGVGRGLGASSEETGDRVVLARLAEDPPLSEPGSFRSLLNSFLPRKRAIGQMLVRDGDGRVLMCQLTYKRDWDLPGGVVEMNESPALAVAREVNEELGLEVASRGLLLTDWLPAWGGWDDALCLVFDGGVLPADVVDRMVFEEREIRSAAFLTAEEVAERARDFTARRVTAALANLESGGPAFTESGRAPG